MAQTVIIGNSAAGLKAVETFRLYDRESPVTLISREPGAAYSRVLLPYYLRNRIPFDNLFIRKPRYYSDLNITLKSGSPVVSLDVPGERLILDDGSTVNYEKLLIATGAHPVVPPIENLQGPGVCHMWTLDDARTIEPLFGNGKRVLIIGSGFVSLQAAWAALCRGLEVVIVELMDRIMPRVLDSEGSAFLHERIVSAGAEVCTGTVTEGVERLPSGELKVFLRGEKPHTCDLIIVGAGVRPNVDFLSGSPLEERVQRAGIAVDNRMMVDAGGIYAAGDVALGSDVFGNPHSPCALWPTAVDQGKIAGANMAGKKIVYTGSLNMNVTEMFHVTVASMGRFQDDEVPDDNNREKPAVWKSGGRNENRYVKIVAENNVPVGGVVLGNAEDVKILGAVRTVIRKKMEIEDPDKTINDLLGDPGSLRNRMLHTVGERRSG